MRTKIVELKGRWREVLRADRRFWWPAAFSFESSPNCRRRAQDGRPALAGFIFVRRAFMRTLRLVAVLGALGCLTADAAAQATSVQLLGGVRYQAAPWFPRPA